MDITISYTPEDVKYLRKKAWVLIPLFEEKNAGLTKYLESLIHEMNGWVKSVNKDVAPFLKSAICILRELHEDSIKGDYEFTFIRRQIFNCSDLIKKSFRVV